MAPDISPTESAGAAKKAVGSEAINSGTVDSIVIPSDYIIGYKRAQAVYPERATNYLAHTHTGDPLADELMEQLSSLTRAESNRFISAALDDPEASALRDAPPAVGALIEELETPPDWLDTSAFAPGIRLFHRNSYAGLAAMLGGVLVEGFSTNISKSFFITGRLRDQGVRRLQQNNRHLIEILLPGGMETRGDGWKLSVRLRLVHARVRHLFNGSDEWDTAAWGIPISAAHLGFSITAFSARMLQHMKSLGAEYDDDERDGFMAVWRYAGHLMGIPETILFHDYEDALELFKVGHMCEPEPSLESIVMANSLINSAPLVAGETDAQSRRKLARYIFTVSRAMIGSPLANDLMYPKGQTFGVLHWFRMQRRYHRFMNKYLPALSRESSFTAFSALLDVSALDDLAITYGLPDHVYAEESSRW